MSRCLHSLGIFNVVGQRFIHFRCIASEQLNKGLISLMIKLFVVYQFQLTSSHGVSYLIVLLVKQPAAIFLEREMH